MANNNNNTMKNILARFVIYTLVIFGLTSSLPIIIGSGDFIAFSEGHAVEWLQFILLAVTAVILFLNSTRAVCSMRQLFTILTLLVLLAAIRESDKILDRWIPILGWQLIAGLCTLIGILYYRRNRDKLPIQISAFIGTRAFSLLWCGFVVAIPFAQLVGHGTFLKLLMGDDYNRDYKRVIEELGELIGYLLIFIGSVESVLQQKEGNNHVVENMD